MRSRLSLGTGTGLAAVGLVLMVVTAVRVLTGSSLGTLGQLGLWAGLGLFVVGALLLLLATLADGPDPVARPVTEPVGEPVAEPTPPSPRPRKAAARKRV
jgi:hypothetical protein